MSELLPVTLTSAAAAAILALWLMIRVGQVRVGEKVSIGDGGNEKVTRRMRAHANFIENTPFVLVLIAAIEISGKGCLLYTSPSPRDRQKSRMPSSA